MNNDTLIQWRKANTALAHPKITLDQRDYWTKVKRDILKQGYGK